MDFKDFNFNEKIYETLKNLGFVSPTLVQQKFIPFAVNGDDILCRSETGSGKTLAFGLPILNNIDSDGVKALICAPTKELAIQIKQVLEPFCKNLGLNICAVFGGSDFTRQRYALKTANIVVGTTGRLIDHIERRTLKLHKLKFLVLDEADVMLDMGFIEDIKKIEKACPKIKQTFMLSATFNEKIKELSKNYLINPQIIEIGVENKIVDKISQCYILCLKKGKFETLVKFLRSLFHEKVIVFVNTKKMTEELYKKLKDKEIETEFINGDLELKERKKVINNFKSSKTNILLATDVASRGLDIENVDCVINYDMPEMKESYVHRIGRTARAGKSGMSLSLINSQNQLEFLLENFSDYNLIELKVKKDDKTNQTIFVKTKTENFDFLGKDNRKSGNLKTKKESKNEGKIASKKDKNFKERRSERTKHSKNLNAKKTGEHGFNKTRKDKENEKSQNLKNIKNKNSNKKDFGKNKSKKLKENKPRRK